MWLLLFAEGTRLNPEKLEASREFAKQRNLPMLKHHLVSLDLNLFGKVGKKFLSKRDAE
jgi:hypothetical protein